MVAPFESHQCQFALASLRISALICAFFFTSDHRFSKSVKFLSDRIRQFLEWRLFFTSYPTKIQDSNFASLVYKCKMHTGNDKLYRKSGFTVQRRTFITNSAMKTTRVPIGGILAEVYSWP